MKNLSDKTLALAAVFQAADLVNQVATTGIDDQHNTEVIIKSIFNLNPENTESIYGGKENLRRGLEMLVEQLGSDNSSRNMDITRYSISLLHLQGKLQRNRYMMNTLAEGIERARQQGEHFSLMHTNVLANLAGIYSDTVSQIAPKIMVSGDSRYLSSGEHANKIRAILLGGIRAAVLWSQVGGSRWQILFYRKRFVSQARQWLDDMPRTLN